MKKESYILCYLHPYIVQKTTSPPYKSYDGLRVGRPGFHSRQGQDLYPSTESRQALGPTQHPIKWESGAVSSGVKQPGREADHSPPSRAEIKDGGVMPPLPLMCSWHSA
jgi:hypothetical protein